MRLVMVIAGLLLAVGCHLIGGAGDFAIRNEAAGGGGQGGSDGGATASCELGVNCPPGTPCTDAAICASGHCVDGVCCGEACAGTCATCIAPGHEGTCRPQAAATDPDGDCAAGICDGAGTCASGAYRWLVNFGNGTQHVLVTGVVADGAGNVYASGRFRDPVDFGGGAVPSVGGKYDAFVVKYDDRGALLWARSIGNGAHDQHATAIARHGGGVVVAGRFKEAVDFGDGVLVESVGAKYDAFIAAYDADGALSWRRTIGNGVHDQFAEGVAVDPDGNVVVGGRFKDQVDFGGGPVASIDSAKYDGFIATFDGQGNFGHAVALGNGLHDQHVDGVAADSEGNVVAVGRFKEAVDFGGGPIPSAGAVYDAFVASYDPSGQSRWVRPIGQGLHDQYATSVSIASDGSIFVGGRIKGAVDLGGGETVPAGDPYDAFVAKYETGGGFGWARLVGSGLADQRIFGVTAVEPSGVVVAGALTGTVDLGGATLESAGAARDAFVARYASEGVLLWAKAYGNGEIDQRATAAAATEGVVFVVGELQGTVDFGAGPVSSNGARDEGFVLALSP